MMNLKLETRFGSFFSYVNNYIPTPKFGIARKDIEFTGGLETRHSL